MKIICIKVMDSETESLTVNKVYDTVEWTSGIDHPEGYLIHGNNGHLIFALKDYFVLLREVNLNKLL